MMEAAQHAEPTSTPLWSRWARLVLWGLLLLGGAAFLLGASGAQPGRAWQIYLVNYLFWSGLAVTGVVMAAMWQVTNSVWGRRLTGAALVTSGFLPVALLAFLPLIAGREHILPWLGHPKANRAVWLEPTFFFTRNFLSLALLYALAAVYAYYLLQPAKTRAGSQSTEAENARAERVLRRLAPVLLILYALVLSLVGFDLVMSLDVHFASTLFGVYYFVTNLYSGLALLAVLMGVWLARQPRLAEVITSEDLHRLGKLIFGFCMLYGMVFWSQYLVIWYGNLLEEIPFVIHRQHEQPWAPVSYTMILLSLVGPFCILLSAAVKKNPRTLAAVGGLILVGMWLERYVLVVPSLWPAAGEQASGSSAHALPLGGMELAVSAGFAAAMLLCCDAFARAFPITLGAVPLEGQGHLHAH